MDTEAKKMKYIVAAASSIKDDIKSVAQHKDTYPTGLSMSTVEACAAFIPRSLQLFLKALFVSTGKRWKYAQ